MHPTVSGIVKTSIVTAFTLATALIWKDVIVEAIELFVPQSNALIYKLLAAIFSTVLVVIAIYIILNTEYRAEEAFKRLQQKHASKHKK